MKRVLIYFALALLVLLPVVTGATTVTKIVKSGDTGIEVCGPLSNYATPYDSSWSTCGQAVATWKHPSWPLITGSSAIWISTAYNIEEAVNDSWRWFHYHLACSAYNISGTVVATSDNAEELYFNGILVGSDGEVQGPFIDNLEWQTLITYSIPSQAGENTLDFIVRNYAQAGGTPSSNPTGLLFQATINYELPDVVWQPPVTNDAFELKDGTTLPLKFKLYTQAGELITEMQDVYMIIACGMGTEKTEVWYLGEGVENLRFDMYENYYIANFKTKNYDDSSTWSSCTATVRDYCSDEDLGSITFDVNTSSGTGRGNK